MKFRAEQPNASNTVFMTFDKDGVFVRRPDPGYKKQLDEMRRSYKRMKQIIWVSAVVLVLAVVFRSPLVAVSQLILIAGLTYLKSPYQGLIKRLENDYERFKYQRIMDEAKEVVESTAQPADRKESGRSAARLGSGAGGSDEDASS